MFDDGVVLREIQLPDGTKTHGDLFVFVKVYEHNAWKAALLTAWHRTPDGWACTICTPRYQAAFGTVTRTATYAYDPDTIRQLTAADLNPKQAR